ncbi:hypothetical protein AB0451_03285 [Streptomyces sp. NPDC052000]|uniref:hypothetical protein n=1 Tax=Streptomyces sp. NPDC052000 TaxID=3155676 RepID=UPI00344DBA7E
MAALDHSAMRVIELYRALKAMGPDTDRIARISLRTISGDPVGELVLSTQDVERLLVLLAEPDADGAAQLVADVEAFLADGGGA